MASTYRYEMTNYNGTDYDTLLPKSAYSTTVNIQLGKWDDRIKSQTVVLDVVSADDDILVTYAPASHDVFVNSGVYCSAQADGSLTFKYTKKPTADIVANVMLL